MPKFLYQPLRPFRVFQNFGENMACSNPDRTGVVSELPDHTCPVGKVKLYPLLGLKGHNGLDCQALRWQPVYAAQDGRVDEVSTDLHRGLGVGIRTQVEGRWFRHRYWHLIAIDVDNGAMVKTGDLIGLADSTGLSSGDHLHFELKEVDMNGRVLNQDNGYFGAIDPLPFMENKFALDVKGLVSQISLIREKLALLTDRVADWLRGR